MRLLDGGRSPTSRRCLLSPPVTTLPHLALLVPPVQAVLKLYSEVPPGFADWQHRLRNAVLLIVNGPHPAEQRVIAITWGEKRGMGGGWVGAGWERQAVGWAAAGPANTTASPL